MKNPPTKNVLPPGKKYWSEEFSGEECSGDELSGEESSANLILTKSMITALSEMLS
jgi:hypothetical protein